MLSIGGIPLPVRWRMLIVYNCCNKLPQAWWFKTTQLYSLWRPEVWNQYHRVKVKVLAGLQSFHRPEGRTHVLPPPDSGGCCYLLACGSIAPPIFASMDTLSPPLSACQVSLCLSLRQTLVIIQIIYLKSLSWITSTNTIFSYKKTFAVFRN